MNRRVSLGAVAALSLLTLLVASSAQAQDQHLTGKWVCLGARGPSVLEFYPGEKGLLGAVRGSFHHSLVLDDGRVIEGYGNYVLRSLTSHRGRLIMHFSDGHVTREIEHTFGPDVLRLEHHGITRVYNRQ